MPRVDETVVGFTIYEDAIEHMGITEATLPEVSNIVQEVQGAGVGGKYEAVVTGSFEAMALTLNFRTVTKNTIRLCEPRVHNIDLRQVQQVRDTTKNVVELVKVKHNLLVFPKKTSFGKVATASTADASGEYSVSYFATYMDGKKILEIDPLNYIFFVNGKDYLAEVRQALGK